MLSIALGVGFALSERGSGRWVAVLLGLAVCGGAVVLGRRIRRNVVLQCLASCFLGLMVAPIAIEGGADWGRSWLVGVGLAVAFAAAALSIQGVLLRARKQHSLASVAVGLSVLLPAAAVGVAGSLGAWGWALALGSIQLWTLGVGIAAPGPRRLKELGWSVSVAHVLTATLLCL